MDFYWVKGMTTRCEQDGLTRLDMRVTIGTNREYIPIPLGATSDCAYARVFARALNMDNMNPDLYEAISSNCCDPGTGTICDATNRVTRIAFPGKLLNGYINADAIPPKTVVLNLANNQIRGFTSTTFPESLRHIQLSDNQISGTLPPLPPLLAILDVKRNNFTLGLQSLSLDDSAPATNIFHGSIVLTKPKRLEFFGNQITSIQVADSSLLDNTNCIFSRNPLAGSSVLANLGMCIQNWLV